jgi:K+-sensing histidine kinase KdpD
MTRGWTSKYRYSAAQCLLGGVGIALATFVCCRPGVDIATACNVYLVLMVCLAQMSSFIGSIVLSIFAVGCLASFFSAPILGFQMDETEILLAVFAFLMKWVNINDTIIGVLELTRTEVHGEMVSRSKQIHAAGGRTIGSLSRRQPGFCHER